MIFRRAQLHNFRSYEQAEFNFEAPVTVVSGPNGSGKTNLLEALYLLSTTKGFRGGDSELVGSAAAWYKVAGALSAGDVEVRYQPEQTPPKRVLVGGRRVKAEEYIGRAPTVLFEPGMYAIVGGGPQARRRFLDGVLATADKEYLANLVRYRRVLRQRNNLLRRAPEGALSDQLFAWDIKLVDLASQLVRARTELAEFIASRFGRTYSRLSGDKTKLKASYDTLKGDDYPAALSAALSGRLKRDRILGHTSVGPHRDDLEITFQGAPAGAVASRGESRSLILALKIIEARYITQKTKQKPALLLDDVFSELDPSRQALLLAALGAQQSIITTTHLDKIERTLPKDHQLLKLK